jgi:hypothetical protein
MELLDCLEDQMSIEFTGKVNITDISNNQLLGVLLFREGHLVHSSYKSIIDISAIAKAYLTEAEGHKFNYIVEPEIITPEQEAFFYSKVQLKAFLTDEFEKHILSKKLKPKEELLIYINPQFIIDGETKITEVQIKLLKIINDYINVKDIYFHAPFVDRIITNNLVELRKMKALKVSNKS